MQKMMGIFEVISAMILSSSRYFTMEIFRDNFSEFVYWTFTGDINKFYEDFKWTGWQDEVKYVLGDEGISIYPFLWAEGDAIEKRSRRIVPIEEIWGITNENRKNLGIS